MGLPLDLYIRILNSIYYVEVMHCAWLWCAVVVWWQAEPVVAVVGGDVAAPPEPDAAVVFVQKHGRSARVEGLKNDKFSYFTFYGIRYAEPPVGLRRFQRPVRRYLAGELSATTPCSVCPQPGSNLLNIIGREDCLCLNVFAPKMPENEKGSPVVVFIHGGNYKTGSASPYGGKHLTQEDTLLVVPQYRLGSLGYITNGEREASGNAGLYDLLIAMTWVKDYIEFFGGDPTRVVIMGQGSGASTASLLALSTEGRTATGVAALSGTPLSPGAVQSKPEDHAKQIANRTNCPPEPVERFILCLRKLPVETIIKADIGVDTNVDTDKFLNEISGRSGTGARVEGQYDDRGLPTLVDEQPGDVLKKKKQRIPLFTGVTLAETRRAVFGKYSNFLKNKLRVVSDFIKKEILGRLQNTVKTINTIVPVQKTAETVQHLPPVVGLTEYYHRVLDNAVAAVEGLTKIAEATGDALFNFPAYQSVRAWSLGAPSFLYSFEFVGNLTKGSHFLPGVALAENSEQSAEAKESAVKGPAHGDELAYIFDPLNEEGKSIETDDVSLTDSRVRKAFVGMIAKFARDLNPMGKKNDTKFLGFLPFSKDNDQFLRIDDKISLDKNFRFCQMGLWGNMGERLTGTLCKTLFEGLLNPLKLLTPVTGNETGLANLIMAPTAGQFSQNNEKNPPQGVVPVILNLNKNPENRISSSKPSAKADIPGVFGVKNSNENDDVEREDESNIKRPVVSGVINLNTRQSPIAEQNSRPGNTPSVINLGNFGFGRT
ncbi:carboxylesterase 5A [Plodia interpunctella]|nr:carboxylesterase 5A [Plodia interpunctella]